MITIHLFYTGTGDNARLFAREMLSSGTVAAIRAEPGNLGYDYYYPAEDDRTVLLIDRWDSQQALDAHHHSPMMQTIAALREKYDLHMRVERLVPEESGMPEGDAAYLRR